MVFGRGQQVSLADAVRQALITGPLVETRLEGKATYFGVPSNYMLEIGDGCKYVQRISGPLGEVFGFDGKTEWKEDRSGAPRVMGFEDGDEERAIVGLLTDQWIDAGTRAVISPDVLDVNTIDVTSPSGLDERVTVDPNTLKPAKAVFHTTDGEVDIKLSDWRPAAGRQLPFAAEVTRGGLTDKFQVNGATAAMGDYGEPAWKPSDAGFNPSVSPNLETKKAPFGLILVHPKINGKDVGWFILDSGSEVMVIDPKVADKLHLTKIGKQPLTGVGGTIQAAFRTGGEVTLGPLTIHNVIFTEFDLGQLGNAFKINLGGIVGYDVFRRSIVAVDVKTPAVSIYQPDKYHLPKGAYWTEMLFDGGNPVVQASCEGNRMAWYRLDTGDPSSVTFHAPYVNREHLLDSRTLGDAATGGVGGQARARTGQIGWFQLGGHRFENENATFSLADKGAFANRYLAGNIGQALMMPFVTTFDFGADRVAFVPREPALPGPLSTASASHESAAP